MSKRISRSLMYMADSLLSRAARNSLLDAVSMNQVRLDSLRLVHFADVLGLLDEILDFEVTLRDVNDAPLHPTRPAA